MKYLSYKFSPMFLTTFRPQNWVGTPCPIDLTCVASQLFRACIVVGHFKNFRAIVLQHYCLALNLQVCKLDLLSKLNIIFTETLM